MKRPLLFAAVPWLLLAVGSAVSSAAPRRDLRAEVADLESQASQLGRRFQPSDEVRSQTPQQRLVEAEVLHNLGDYTQAAILFLDYVQRFPTAQGYPEALYYLGDSLYQRRDFLGARRTLEQLVARGPGSYYQQGLERLIEVALRTGELAAAEPHVQALERVSAAEARPVAHYLRGKYYFFTRRLDRALSAFRAVALGQPYHRQAIYFTGVCLVAQRDLPAARATFAGLLAQLPPGSGGEAERRLRDLTHLALGRLLYQQGELVKAADHYQQVSRQAEAFDTALYETAWVYIKQRRFEPALRALDLLVLAQPDSSLVPEVLILQGNLLIRLEQWGRASEVFTQLREKFDPAHNALGRLLAARNDPVVFFDALLARDLERGASALAVAAEVPSLATQWAKELQPVRRGLAVVEDVAELDDSLAQTQRLILRLQGVVDSPQKIRIFPAFAAAREGALEVENRLAQARQRILARERELVYPLLGASERQQVEQLAADRAAVEQRIARLPTDQRAFDARSSSRAKRIMELEGELSRLGVTVASLRAQLVAVEKFFADTTPARDTAVRGSFESEAGAVRADVLALEREADSLEIELANAREAAGVGGPQEVAERALKERYRVLVDEEHRLLAQYRARVSAPRQQELNGLDVLVARCDAVDTTLRLFNAELERGVEQRLQGVRAALAEEHGQLHAQRDTVTGFQGEADQVVGGVAHEGYRTIEDRFRDLVIRSDIGIIDVSWALKEAKSNEVSRLVRQRKLDLQLLDDEFKEVLVDK